MIRETRIRAGECLLDRQTGEFMENWETLSTSASKRHGLNDMIGKRDAYTAFDDNSGALDLYIPLQFWFCRHEEVSFPLVALQSHELRVEFDFRPLEQLV